MDREELSQAIEARLSDRKRSVLNRNAFTALFGAFADPVGALGKVFLGRAEAVDQERQRIQQDFVLDLLCRMDDALTAAKNQAERAGVKWHEITGQIEATAVGGDSVTGLHVASDGGAVELKPGTSIRAAGFGTRNVTGMKIGGND